MASEHTASNGLIDRQTSKTNARTKLYMEGGGYSIEDSQFPFGSPVMALITEVTPGLVSIIVQLYSPFQLLPLCG